jgi:hypothetical protein
LCPLAFPNHLLTTFHDPLLGFCSRYLYAFGLGRSFGHAFEILRVFHLVVYLSSVVPVCFNFKRIWQKNKSVDVVMDIVHFFLDTLNTILLFHWDTPSYAAHKATDHLYKRLSELVDSYVEIDLRDRNMKKKPVPTTFRVLDHKDFIKNMANRADLLAGMTLAGDLASIRDDMVAEIHHAFYLLKKT